MTFRVHGTCIEIGGHGVLLRGPSAAGKSDLALRLIDGGAVLVADDQAEITVVDGLLVAAAPPVLAGLLEVRGLGIMRLPHCAAAVLRLVVDLVETGTPERLPAPGLCHLCGLPLRTVALAPFEASAPAKVRLAVRLATGDIFSAHD